MFSIQENFKNFKICLFNIVHEEIDESWSYNFGTEIATFKRFINGQYVKSTETIKIPTNEVISIVEVIIEKNNFVL